MHPTTWKASGHVDSFSDPLIDNKDSKKRYRVDHLIEGHAEKMLAQATKMGETGAALSEAAAKLIADMDALLANDDYVGLKKLIDEHKIQCSVSGTGNWTEIRQFNLMF